MRVDEERIKKSCTGCGACACICPKHAINMEFNDEGYLQPTVSADKCVDCGICMRTCPSVNDIDNRKQLKRPSCFAVQADDSHRIKSSSGGFFSILSEKVIESGGSVFGAVWGDEFICHIVEARNLEELEPMRLSKYVQADSGTSFRIVEDRLKQNKKVAYFGCPCQIAGLKAYLSNQNLDDEMQNSLITIDLVCFCAPSNKLFQKYLDEEYGLKNVERVLFRDKASHGWCPNSYSVWLKNGKLIQPEIGEDPYQIAFHSVLARNSVCDKCVYYNFPRQGDFTIGDFWGIDVHDAWLNDGKGVSVVLINNDKAKDYFMSLTERFKTVREVPLEWCMNKGNRIGGEARETHPNRDYFNNLVKHLSFKEAVDRAVRGHFDIGCVCMFNYNVGNNLTNFALYKTIRKLGYFPLMIGSPMVNGTLPGGCERNNRFKRFLNVPYESWSIAPVCESKEELIELNDRCDLFIVGSDQLWRDTFLKQMDDYTALDWVNSSKYKMSFSTSFGTDEFEGTKSDKKRFQFLLDRFQSVSVREQSGKNIINTFSDNHVQVVLDPVFTCDIEEYDKLADTADDINNNQKYVAAYILDKTHAKEQFFMDISHKLSGGRYVAMTDYPEYELQDGVIEYVQEPSIEQWLAIVRGCEFFLTDSFHGICFAILFHIDFVVIYDKDNWRGYTRILDILQKFSLMERLIDANKDSVSKVLDSKIEWNRVDEVLNKARDESMHWLKEKIQEGKNYIGKYDVFEEMISREKRLYENRKEQLAVYMQTQEKIKQMRSDLFLHEKMIGKPVNCKSEGTKDMITVGFGAGDCFRRNIANVKKYYDLKYVCDNDPLKWGTEIGEGVLCISPKKLLEMHNVLVIIMIDDVATSFDVAEQLVEMGITSFTHVVNWIRMIEK